MKLFILLTLLTISLSIHDFEYCIIGAGPAGLQLGYFLHQDSKNYVILEKAKGAGSFFEHYPRQRNLISINKVHVESKDPDFLMRHDWNSLLTDNHDWNFKNYSKDYYPKADDMVKYLNGFATKYNLNIHYQTHAINVERDGKFKITTLKQGKEEIYTCKVLVNAIGVSFNYVPEFIGGQHYVEKYSDTSNNPNDYLGQRILILGKGNSAFELAEFMTPYANLIHLISRKKVRMSYETHYVGDVRAIKNQLLDQYQLKSFDAIGEFNTTDFSIIKRDGMLYLEEPGVSQYYGKELHPFSYHRIISCAGFRPNITFLGKLKPQMDGISKYPILNEFYESSVPDMYFAGTLMHYKDWRKSAGGFIHGFRYLIQNLYEMLQLKYEKKSLPSRKMNIGRFFKNLIYRINHASSMYQMVGTLGDVVLLPSELIPTNVLRMCFRANLKQIPKECKKYKVRYYEDVQVAVPLPGIKTPSGKFLTITLEYNPDFHGAKVFNSNRFVSHDRDSHKSNFLHPIVREFDMNSSKNSIRLDSQCHKKSDCPILKDYQMSEHHLIEEFWGRWDIETTHIHPLREYLIDILSKKQKVNEIPSDFFDEL